LDALTLFGLFAVSAMLVFYALEEHSPVYILAFAGACGLASLYGFLQGAWPFSRSDLVGGCLQPLEKKVISALPPKADFSWQGS
jgi:hypothetical protein